MESSKNIVLVHGWGAGVEKLEPLSVELKKLAWRVVVLSLPGFDLPSPEKTWSINEYSQYVGEEAVKFFGGKKFFLFGHSFGGRIAIRLAALAPEGLIGIVLCATSGISRGNFLKRIVFLLLAKIGKVLLVFPPVALLWRKLLYKLAREHDYEKTDSVMKATFKKVVKDDSRPFIPLIRLPTLVLWGRKDRMTPLKDAYFISRKLSNGKLVLFDNQGHRLPYEKPKEVAGAIDKWAKNFL